MTLRYWIELVLHLYIHDKNVSLVTPTPIALTLTHKISLFCIALCDNISVSHIRARCIFCADDETPHYLQHMLEAQAQFSKLLALRAIKTDTLTSSTAAAKKQQQLNAVDRADKLAVEK